MARRKRNDDENVDFYAIGQREGEMHIQSIAELSPILGLDPIEQGQHAALAARANLDRLESMGWGDCEEAVRTRGYLSRFD